MKIPQSINFHLTQKCNYACKFCFAKYNEHSKMVSSENAKKLIEILAKNGCQKINFAGGEPTLVPYLSNLLKFAKKQGLFVSLITNGTGISNTFLKNNSSYIDMIGISIDSSNHDTLEKLGRRYKNADLLKENGKKFKNHIQRTLENAELIHGYNIPLKINTTITSINWNEDIHELILKLNPVRWKVFQFYPVSGITDDFLHEFGIVEDWQFNDFINRHIGLNPKYETNSLMSQSYCMITPDGRFYQNTGKEYEYSESLIEVGIEALNNLNFSNERFQQREGDFFMNNNPIEVLNK